MLYFCQKLYGLIGRLCWKVSGTRKLHGIELHFIQCKFLIQVLENVSPNSIAQAHILSWWPLPGKPRLAGCIDYQSPAILILSILTRQAETLFIYREFQYLAHLQQQPWNMRRSFEAEVFFQAKYLPCHTVTDPTASKHWRQNNNYDSTTTTICVLLLFLFHQHTLIRLSHHRSIKNLSRKANPLTQLAVSKYWITKANYEKINNNNNTKYQWQCL